MKKFFKSKFEGENITKMFLNKDIKLIDFLFYYHNSNNMKLKFEIIDNITSINKLGLKTIDIYSNVYMELRKRKVFFRVDDFNYLFLQNILLFQEFLYKNHIVNNVKEYIHEASEQKYIVNYQINIKNKKIPNGIKGFKNMSDIEKFNSIFDFLVLQNPRINKKNYFLHMNNGRLEFKNINSIDVLKLKDIDIKGKFSSKTPFRTKKFRYIKGIDIYAIDITKKEYDYLFEILNSIFFNKEYTVRVGRDFDIFKKTRKNHLNVYLLYKNSIIDTKKWVHDDKYILTYTDFKNDLIYMLCNKLENKINILKSKEYQNLTINEKRKIYNAKYYTAKRINEYIEKMKVKEDE